LPEREGSLDNAKEMSALAGIGQSLAREWLPKVRSRFISDGPVKQFFPIPELILPENNKLKAGSNSGESN